MFSFEFLPSSWSSFSWQRYKICSQICSLSLIFFSSCMSILIKNTVVWISCFFSLIFVCLFVCLFSWSSKTQIIHNWSIHLSVGTAIIMVGWYCHTSCYCCTSDTHWTVAHLVLPTLPPSAFVCCSISVWCWLCSFSSKEVSCVKGMIPWRVAGVRVEDAHQNMSIKPLIEINLCQESKWNCWLCRVCMIFEKYSWLKSSHFRAL